MQRINELPVVYLSDHTPVAHLSHYIGQASFRLLTKHPRLWLANAIDSWKHTYIFDGRVATPPLDRPGDPRTVDDKPVTKSASLYRFVARGRAIQAWPMVAAYWLSLGYLALFVVWLCRPRSIDTASVFVFAVTCATFGTFAAFCIIAVFFPHYGIPYWSSLVLCGSYMLHRIVSAWFSKTARDVKSGGALSVSSANPA